MKIKPFTYIITYLQRNVMSIKLINFWEIQQHCLFVALVDSYFENKAFLVIEIEEGSIICFGQPVRHKSEIESLTRSWTDHPSPPPLSKKTALSRPRRAKRWRTSCASCSSCCAHSYSSDS